MHRREALIKKYNHPWKFRLGMWLRLPSIAFWNVKLESLDHQACAVSLKYGWATKNPFGSIYFAAMAGAGELSTGLLSTVISSSWGEWSMLVTDIHAEYYKKATGRIYFHCEDGDRLNEFLTDLVKEGKSGTIEMVSTARNAEELMVARIIIKWSFKLK